MGLLQYVPLMSSTGEKGDKLPAGLRSAVETLRPIVVKHGRMGNLSLLAGGFAILKGLAALRSSKGKALRQIAVGAGWIAIGRAQQQAGSEEIEVSEPWTSDDRESADEGESGVIADTNQQGPRDFGDPETGETPEGEGAGEEGEIAGPTSGDAVPETDKEGGPEGRADDIEMVDPDPDEASEGELQAEDGDDEE
jgi:hypothetical protein